MKHSPFSWVRVNRSTVVSSLRATIACVASMLLTRLFKLPEFYWAPISTIVILLSTINPWTLAWQRFVGTALGAVVGAIIATFFQPTWITYAAGIFVCGILSAVFRIGQAYRFAAITLSIVLLIVHTSPPWIVALHRFFEVSLGIAVALAASAVWPDPLG